MLVLQALTVRALVLTASPLNPPTFFLHLTLLMALALFTQLMPGSLEFYSDSLSLEELLLIFWVAVGIVSLSQLLRYCMGAASSGNDYNY